MQTKERTNIVPSLERFVLRRLKKVTEVMTKIHYKIYRRVEVLDILLETEEEKQKRRGAMRRWLKTI